MTARENGKGKTCGCSWSKRDSEHSYQEASGYTGTFTETFTPGLSSKGGIDEMDQAVYFALYILHSFHTKQLYT